MIIIAVSRYRGSYINLPGAITSAQRLRQWAEQQDEDCGYKVLYLGDDELPGITVDLLRDKITTFVDTTFMDRLVVYFAGHGIVRSAGDQFWLLTNAEDDEREGINVEAFRRGLLKCNIGQHNDQVNGQLCLIGDACRNTARDAINFSGDPILTRTGRKNTSIQLDRFLSTGLGDYSFQMDETDGHEAYCLFSEVLLGALAGEVLEAIETEYHQFKPAVTNHKLAEYLETEVKARAAAIDESMEPDLLTGIHPPYNFYKRLNEPVSINEPRDPQLTEAKRMAIQKPQQKDVNDQTSRDRGHSAQVVMQMALNDFTRDERYAPFRFNNIYSEYRGYSAFFSDFRPSRIAIPSHATIEVVPYGGIYGFIAMCYGDPILVEQDDKWIILPAYPRVASVLLRDYPGDVLLHKFNYKTRYYNWDTYLSDFLNLDRDAPLRAADAGKFADKIRVGKEKYPHQAVTAGYLYEFSNDYDNIARTAHYMAIYGVVPFDLALLCADAIRWRKEADFVVAYADIPATESVSNDVSSDRPSYTKTAFPASENVRLWGIAPIFRQGWSFMQTEQYLQIPDTIRRIGEETNGRSAASLTREGLEMFRGVFDYRIIETEIGGEPQRTQQAY